MPVLQSKKVTKALEKADKAGLNKAIASTLVVDGMSEKQATQIIKIATKYYKKALKATDDEEYAQSVALQAAAIKNKSELKNINAEIKAVKAALKAKANTDYIEAVKDNATAENAKIFAQLTKQIKKGTIKDAEATKLAATVGNTNKADSKAIIKEVKKAAKADGSLEGAIAKAGGAELDGSKDNGPAVPEPNPPTTPGQEDTSTNDSGTAAPEPDTPSTPVQNNTSLVIGRFDNPEWLANSNDIARTDITLNGFALKGGVDGKTDLTDLNAALNKKLYTIWGYGEGHIVGDYKIAYDSSDSGKLIITPINAAAGEQIHLGDTKITASYNIATKIEHHLETDVITASPGTAYSPASISIDFAPVVALTEGKGAPTAANIELVSMALKNSTAWHAGVNYNLSNTLETLLRHDNESKVVYVSAASDPGDPAEHTPHGERPKNYIYDYNANKKIFSVTSGENTVGEEFILGSMPIAKYKETDEALIVEFNATPPDRPGQADFVLNAVSKSVDQFKLALNNRGDDYIASKIIGSTGNNTLSGTDGNDIIITGGGADILIGGAGADSFIVTASTYGASKDIVTIRDFKMGEDTITGLLAVGGDSPVVLGAKATPVINELMLNADLSEFFDDILTDINVGAHQAEWFEFKRDTYLVYGGATTDNNTDDVVIKLTGRVDLEGLKISAGVLDIA